MAFDLVTARHGKSHIMADMIARQNSAMFGQGRFILNVGDCLKPTMTSANKLNIASGAMIADGRYIENTDTYTFDIANGTQAQYRKDLAVLTVNIGSDYIGTITPSVLKGTPASTLAAATDPAYTAGNLLNGDTTAVIPLARVTLNGLTPSVALIPDSVKDLSTLGDSVSPVIPSLKITPASGITIRSQSVRKVGSVLFLQCDFVTSTNVSANTSIEIGSIQAPLLRGVGSATTGCAWIDGLGGLKLKSTSQINANTSVYCQFVALTNQE